MQRPLVFILGIEVRSGTNYLRNLLLNHPRCEATFADPRGEDFLCAQLPVLEEFTNSLASHLRQWEDYCQSSEVEPKLRRDLSSLLRRIAESLGPERLAGEGKESPILVTKTPSTVGLELFPKFFPDDKLIILVRDGMDLVESAAIGFGWDRMVMMESWRDSARRILAFAESASPASYLLVKYEDLVERTEAELARILAYLELDLAEYPIEKALAEPVYGSSGLKSPNGEIIWHGVEKPADFKSVGRAGGWSPLQIEKFRRVAGEEMTRLGYPMPEQDNPLYWKTYFALKAILGIIREILRLPLRMVRSVHYRAGRHLGLL